MLGTGALLAPAEVDEIVASGGDCVEVADNLPGRVLVRDSKDRAGGALSFTPAAWRTFVGQAQAVPQV
ncbi:DUF397 domain-containing protein [Micromonospora sp. NPDC049282]|uniref:DUF397 domain-containing protein n=1 Tax=Micromonospora sp. NPDC049282 TaxID=3364269 RepID=UPI003711A265